MNADTDPVSASRSTTDIEPPFLLDANVWIRAWDRYYPTGVFRKLWDDLALAVREGTIIIPEQIGSELTDKATGLDAWIDALEPHWVPHDVAVETQMAAIIARFRGLVYKGRRAPRSTGDAALIATAIIREGSVISHEKYRVEGDRPTVTGVCDHYRVPWDSNLAAVFLHLAWQY